ncbi:MAG: radical SAM protein [Syntrophobacteraceae bacterium]
MTKNCIAPWRMLQVNVDGGIRPCCGPVEGDFGNIDDALLDMETFRSVFANGPFSELRQQLLTGNLKEACVTCRIAPIEQITTDTLQRHVVNYLRSRGKQISSQTKLCSEFCFIACDLGITDKCNCSCIYCFIHSNDKPGDGMKKYSDTNQERVFRLASLLSQNGLQVLNIGGLGELTMYSPWKTLCAKLFDNYPNLQITLVSNFGKKFTDADLDVLMRFHRITISCDTVDPELYSHLRCGGRLDVLFENISNLKARMRNSAGPILIINVTENNLIIDKLFDLAKYASENEIGLQFSNLILIKGSFAETNKCLTKITDIPDDQVLSAWEIIYDLPKRIAHQNPKGYFDFGPFYDILKRRAEAVTFNRFVPAANELFYRAFAGLHRKNPNAILHKLFRSFSEYSKGILISSGSTVEIYLPFLSAKLKYRAVWVKNNHSGVYIGGMEEASIGSYLSISTVSSRGFYTHVLLEVLAYNLGVATNQSKENIILSEP